MSRCSRSAPESPCTRAGAMQIAVPPPRSTDRPDPSSDRSLGAGAHHRPGDPAARRVASACPWLLADCGDADPTPNDQVRGRRCHHLAGSRELRWRSPFSRDTLQLHNRARGHQALRHLAPRGRRTELFGTTEWPADIRCRRRPSNSRFRMSTRPSPSCSPPATRCSTAPARGVGSDDGTPAEPGGPHRRRRRHA